MLWIKSLMKVDNFMTLSALISEYRISVNRPKGISVSFCSLCVGTILIGESLFSRMAVSL